MRNIVPAKCELGLPNQKVPINVWIEFKDTEIKISYFKGGFSFKWERIILKPEDVIDVNFDQETYRSAGGAATGAIVGGLLTGGIGLLIGAAFGGRRKKDKRIGVNVLIGGAKTQLIFAVKYNAPRIYSGFNRMMALKATSKNL